MTYGQVNAEPRSHAASLTAWAQSGRLVLEEVNSSLMALLDTTFQPGVVVDEEWS